MHSSSQNKVDVLQFKLHAKARFRQCNTSIWLRGTLFTVHDTCRWWLGGHIGPHTYRSLFSTDVWLFPFTNCKIALAFSIDNR